MHCPFLNLHEERRKASASCGAIPFDGGLGVGDLHVLFNAYHSNILDRIYYQFQLSLPLYDCSFLRLA